MTLLPRDRVLDVLTSLVDKSLAVYEERDGVGRYRLLETVGQYAGEHLRDSGEAENVPERHLAWCLSLAEEAEPQIKGPEQAAWLDRLEAEHDNLRSALAWAARRAPESALRLACSLSLFWTYRGHAAEGRAAFAAVPSSANVSPDVRLRSLRAAGILAGAQGDWAGAQPLLEQALAACRAVGDGAGEAEALGRLGEALMNRGDHVAAQARLEEALALNAARGDGAAEAENLGALGYVARERGDSGAARSFLERAVRACEARGDVLLAAAHRGSLAFAVLAQGDPDGAAGLLRGTLADYRRVGNRPGVAWALASLAGLGRDGEAVTVPLLEEALSINREIGNRAGEAWNLGHLGAARAAGGDTGGARQALAEALAISREVGSLPGEADNAARLAALALGEGDLAEARALYARSLALASRLQPAGRLALAVEGCAALALAEGDARRAARLLGAAQAGREGLAAPLPPEQAEVHAATRRGAREALGADAFAEAWSQGRAMALGEAADQALAGDGPAEGERNGGAAGGVFKAAIFSREDAP